MKKEKVRIVIDENTFENKSVFELYKAISIKNAKKTMDQTHTIPDRIFHFTDRKNIESIKTNGLKAGVDGGIFVSRSFEENRLHLIENIIGAEQIYNPIKGTVAPNTADIKDYVIIEGRPVNSYKSKWMRYKDTAHHNQDTRFYLGETLELENIVIHEV